MPSHLFPTDPEGGFVPPPPTQVDSSLAAPFTKRLGELQGQFSGFEGTSFGDNSFSFGDGGTVSLLPGETADQFFGRLGILQPQLFNNTSTTPTPQPPVDETGQDKELPPPPPPKSKVTFEGDSDSLNPNTEGGISSMFQAPQIENPEDSRLTDLLGQFTAGIVSDEDRRIQESQLISQVQEGSANRRTELAERLGGAGVFGGAARSELGSIFGQSERGLATGLAGIQSNILNKNLEGKTKALETLFQLQGLSSEEAREQARLAAGTDRLNLDAELGRGQLALDRIQTNLDNQIAQGRLDLDTASLDFQVALAMEDDQLVRDQMVQDFVIFLMDLLERADSNDKNRIIELIRQYGGGF